MKKLTASVIVSLIVFSCFAQYPKKIELFDVVKMYAPDSIKGDDNPGAYDWNIGSEKKSPFKWKTEGLEFKDDKTMKRAQAIMTINGKSYECAAGTTKQACPWSLILSGARAGYFKYNVVSPNHADIKPKTKLEDLFPNQKFTATLVKSCDKSDKMGFYFYEFIIPGKKKMLAKTSWACNNMGCAMALVFYTYFADADSRCMIE